MYFTFNNLSSRYEQGIFFLIFLRKTDPNWAAKEKKIHICGELVQRVSNSFTVFSVK